MTTEIAVLKRARELILKGHGLGRAILDSTGQDYFGHDRGKACARLCKTLKLPNDKNVLSDWYDSLSRNAKDKVLDPIDQTIQRLERV